MTDQTTAELKPWPLNGYAPGGYMCFCAQCERQFEGDKRAIRCLECAVVVAKSRALEATHPCRHEWYQGQCVHCEILVKDYRSTPSRIEASQAQEVVDDVSDLIDALKSTDKEEGVTIFNHTPEEIGIMVMENHSAVLAALTTPSRIEAGPLLKIPDTAGVCAYDLDECTVTIAFDNEAQVRALIGAIPSRNRVRLADEPATPTPTEPTEGDLLAEIKALYRAYVELLESGRDRITMLGGDCDPVDRMEEGDPALIRARAILAKGERKQ